LKLILILQDNLGTHYLHRSSTKLLDASTNIFRSVRSSACTEKCRKRGIRQLGMPRRCTKSFFQLAYAGGWESGWSGL